MNHLTHEDVEQFRFLNDHSVEFNSLDRYQEISSQSAIYPGQGTSLGLAYAALKLNGEAGELAEHVGKAMRDDSYGPDVELTPERHALIVKEVGDNLWYLGAICRELGITLSEAAAVNLEKLADRTERNALRGSGDSR